MKFLSTALSLIVLSSASLTAAPRLAGLSRQSSYPHALYTALWDSQVEFSGGIARYEVSARNYAQNRRTFFSRAWQGTLGQVGYSENILSFSFNPDLEQLSEHEQHIASLNYTDKAGKQDAIKVFIKQQPADRSGLPQADITYEFANQDINDFFHAQPYWSLIQHVVNDIVGLVFFDFEPIKG